MSADAVPTEFVIRTKTRSKLHLPTEDSTEIDAEIRCLHAPTATNTQTKDPELLADWQLEICKHCLDDFHDDRERETGGSETREQMRENIESAGGTGP